MNSMKKVFLVASIAMLVGVLMVGCGGNPVNDYMKQLDPIADIGIQGAKVYAGLGLEDPEGAMGALQNEIIPKQEDYVSKLKALTDKIKDEKVKSAHALMIQAAELQLEGYQIALQAFQEYDPEDPMAFQEIFQGAQNRMVESQTKTNEFSEAINALTKK